MTPLYELPPPPPKGAFHWKNVSKETRDKELAEYRSYISKVYNNPKNLLEKCFVDVLWKEYIFDYLPGEMSIRGKIKSFFSIG